VSTTEEHTRTPKRAAVASWIGSALEYYDFAVYGTAAALVLNKLFFPEDAPTAVSVLLAMGTVGVAYVVRPLGALVMGPLADKLGRRFVLMLTLFLIGGATFAVGCLPTYNQVGYLAPALLVLCRMIQGLSAAGEQASAISMSLEHADERHRGFTTSWTLQGTQFGTLLATLVFIPFTSLLDDEALHSWGWRIPFWLSAFVVVTAYIIRRKLEEPPSFHEAAASGVVMSPLMQTLRFHKAAVIRIAAAAMVNSVNMVFTVFSVSFATNGVGLDKSTMLWVPVVVNLVALGAIPWAGRISDRIGRKPVFIVGVAGPAVLAYPYLWSITTGNWPLIFLFGILMSGLLYSASNAIWPAFYAEMFPTRVRATGVALGTQIGFAVSGGFAPAIASSLSGENLTNWVGPAIFLSVACLISVVAALTAKETAHLNREDLETVQVSEAETAALRADVEKHGVKKA
jgi:MFS family permease